MSADFDRERDWRDEVIRTPFGDMRIKTTADLPDGVAFMVVGRREHDDTDEEFARRCAVVRDER